MIRGWGGGEVWTKISYVYFPTEPYLHGSVSLMEPLAESLKILDAKDNEIKHI